MKRLGIAISSALLLVASSCGDKDPGLPVASAQLKVGVAAIKLTPCGENPEWDGPITSTGVWGEPFTDSNGNLRYDPGEPFEDDARNTAIDRKSRYTFDGIYLAGFGNDRLATGGHDDLWARVLVIEGPTRKVALVSVDFVGYLLHGTYYGFAKVRQMLDANLQLDAVLFSSTHDHQGPDTLGLWGPEEFKDGKFPLYMQFLDRQIARAINVAAAPTNMRKARVIAAHATPSTDPTLQGLQVRTRCRPPFFYDDELRAMQFVADDGATIATLINWSTHPESLEDPNTEVSSDFPHYIRERVEAALGGTAVYVTGDLGAVEIVGDTCVGGADARHDDGSNEFDSRDNLGSARTQRLGETVGDATVRALRSGAELGVSDVSVASTEYFISGTNDLFNFASNAGILDLDRTIFNLDNCPAGTGICGFTEQHLVSLLDRNGKAQVQMLTAPGELFPELFYGVEQTQRRDCPAANTGLPLEPSIRNAMTAPHRYLIGLSPDELGYIVPGYDYYPPISIEEETPDPCQGSAFDPAHPRRTVPTHYHEQLSIGPDIAATSACYALKLLGRGADADANGACRRALHLP